MYNLCRISPVARLILFGLVFPSFVLACLVRGQSPEEIDKAEESVERLKQSNHPGGTPHAPGPQVDLLDRVIPRYRLKNASARHALYALNKLGIAACYEEAPKRELDPYVDSDGNLAFVSDCLLASIELDGANVAEILNEIGAATCGKYKWQRIPKTDTIVFQRRETNPGFPC